MARVFIAGCGYIGTALAQTLTRAGHQVWGLSRDTTTLPSGIIPLQADLTVPSTLLDLPDRLDCVFYTAGTIDFTEEGCRAAYVIGIQNLLEALCTQGISPQRFIFTSSTGVYHQNNGEVLDENSPAQPQRFSGRCLLEGEALVLEAPLQGINVRLGGIYGPGRTRLLDAVRQGTATCVEGDTAYLNLIHRDDAVGVLLHLMELPLPDRLYIAADNGPVEKNILLRWLAQQIGVPAPQSIHAQDAHEPKRGGCRRYNNARLRKSGYNFKYPTYKEGYRDLL